MSDKNESACSANEDIGENDGNSENIHETGNDAAPKSCTEQPTAEKLPVSHDTLIRMMDCPSLPSHKYFTSSIPVDATFTLSEDE